MNHTRIQLYQVGDVAKDAEGITYGILEAKPDKELPQRSRYTVLRFKDNTEIANFPGYLLVDLAWRQSEQQPSPPPDTGGIVRKGI